jgi:hypothetical protein
MKNKGFRTSLLLIALIMGSYTSAWAQEKKSMLSITPAATFSWYPFAWSNTLIQKIDTKPSAETKLYLDNFGMSFTMGLKLFDKVGAYVDLKIDDPTFQKLVDIAGYVNAWYLMLKFDYHSYGGSVSWVTDTPNPIPDGYNFRIQQTNVSLLLRLDQLYPVKWETLNPMLRALKESHIAATVGIGYARFSMPVEYQIQPDSRLAYSGFGLVSGEVWGFSYHFDTLTWFSELSASGRSALPLINRHLWMYLDAFVGIFFRKGETDRQTIEWMKNENGAPVDGSISPTYTTLNAILGYQHLWDIGKKGRIGFAVGAELSFEGSTANNKDIGIKHEFWHIGPAVRVCLRF